MMNPISGEYSSSQLHTFHPQEGTELAKEELAWLEEGGDLDLDLSEDFTEVGSGEIVSTVTTRVLL